MSSSGARAIKFLSPAFSDLKIRIGIHNSELKWYHPKCMLDPREKKQPKVFS